MTLTLNGLRWHAESPSFLKLIGYDIRLAFDGAVWWLYSIKRSGTSQNFPSRAKAIEWIDNEIKQQRAKHATT